MTFKELAEKLLDADSKRTQGEWSSRTSQDKEPSGYVFIAPGYFMWPQFLDDNDVVKLLKLKPNFRNDSDFIVETVNHIRPVLEAALKMREALEFISNQNHVGEVRTIERDMLIVKAEAVLGEADRIVGGK